MKEHQTNKKNVKKNRDRGRPSTTDSPSKER